MYIIKKIILFSFVIAYAINGFSQEKNDLPFSIYAPKTQLSFLNKESKINYKMEFKNYKFPIVDIEDLKSNIFIISSINFGRTPTNYIYDSYKEIIFNETTKYYDPN